jgi:hypothetical protein
MQCEYFALEGLSDAASTPSSRFTRTSTPRLKRRAACCGCHVRSATTIAVPAGFRAQLRRTRFGDKVYPHRHPAQRAGMAEAPSPRHCLALLYDQLARRKAYLPIPAPNYARACEGACDDRNRKESAAADCGRRSWATATRCRRPVDAGGRAAPAPATLPLSMLQAGRYQPRTRMDETALQELAASIATHGLMQPIVVRPMHRRLTTPRPQPGRASAPRRRGNEAEDAQRDHRRRATGSAPRGWPA